VNQTLSWTNAGLACRSLHQDAHLVVINDAVEQLAVAGLLATSVSAKRRHSVFDAQNFGQNAQKRKTVRQVTQRIFR